MKKEISFKRTHVVSYDKFGHVLFSKEVTDSDDFIEIMDQAWEETETHKVVVEFDFIPIYWVDNKKIYISEKQREYLTQDNKG